MSSPDPSDAIADALARLRGHRGPHGGGHPHRGGHHRPSHRHLDLTPPPSPWFPAAPRGGPARLRMLEALAAASAPLSVSEIGAEIGVDQPRASRLVQQGVELGLVAREADPDDARRTRIALTAHGRKIALGSRGRRRDAVAQALEGFTDAERAELARLLAKLADNWGS